MIKFTGVFDNSFASPMTPLNFVKKYYLSKRGRDELKDATTQQESSFVALKNDESVQHSLRYYTKIAAEIDKVADTMQSNGASAVSLTTLRSWSRQLRQ